LAGNRDRWTAFLISRGATPDEAPDLLQEGLVKASVRLGALREESALSSWFHTILLSTLADHVRSRSAARRRDAAFQKDLLPSTGLDPAPPVTCRCLMSRFERLHPRYAEILRAIDLGGASPADYAARSGRSVSSVHVALHRARRALRAALVEHCGHCATGGACLDCECGGPALK
jgi:RNA polymerase sigma-70 factor (ECF subfamily)